MKSHKETWQGFVRHRAGCKDHNTAVVVVAGLAVDSRPQQWIAFRKVIVGTGWLKRNLPTALLQQFLVDYVAEKLTE